jgi:hypothetical protein
MNQSYEKWARLAELLNQWSSNLNNHSALHAAAQKDQAVNPWFTEKNTKRSLREISKKIHSFANPLSPPVSTKTYLLYIPDTYPLYGLWETFILTILNQKVVIKFRHNDHALSDHIIKTYFSAEISKGIIQLNPAKPKFDAVISHESLMTKTLYHFFQKWQLLTIPNRRPVILLSGQSSNDDYKKASMHITKYFGRSHFNPGLVLVPDDSVLKHLLEHLSYNQDLNMHHKYMNLYEYQQSIHLMNQKKHLDTGNIIISEQEDLYPPTGVLFYKTYNKLCDLETFLSEKANLVNGFYGEDQLAQWCINKFKTESYSNLMVRFIKDISTDG